jgi:hypothetical protein
MVDSTLTVGQGRIRYPWMFGSTVDVCFYFVPILLGFLLYALMQSVLFQSAFWAVLIINAFGAGPFHQGATWFAYLDQGNRTEFSSTFKKRLIFFVAPVAITLVSMAMAVFPPTYTLLIAVWTVWSLQHLVQQNVGILLLYHNHGKQEAIVPKVLEARSLQVPAIAFGLIFFFRVLMRGSLPQIMLPVIACVSIYAVVVVVRYLLSLSSQMKSGAYLNMPAFLFWLCSAISLLPLAFLGKGWEDGYIVPITAHWFQYIALNYVLVKNKYQKEQVSALPIAQPLVLFFAVCLLIVIAMMGVSLVKVYTVDSLASKAMAGFVLGLGNVHYFLDAFMWRFREPSRRAAILPYLLVGR